MTTHPSVLRAALRDINVRLAAWLQLTAAERTALMQALIKVIGDGGADAVHAAVVQQAKDLLTTYQRKLRPTAHPRPPSGPPSASRDDQPTTRRSGVPTPREQSPKSDPLNFPPSGVRSRPKPGTKESEMLSEALAFLDTGAKSRPTAQPRRPGVAQNAAQSRPPSPGGKAARSSVRLTKAQALQQMTAAVANVLSGYADRGTREDGGTSRATARKLWMIAQRAMADFQTKDPSRWGTSSQVLAAMIGSVIKAADQDGLIPEALRPLASKAAADAVKSIIDAVKDRLDGEMEAFDESLGESGWEIARKRLQRPTAGTPATPGRVTAAGQGPNGRSPGNSPVDAEAARKRIAAAASPAFAAALDTAANADLILRMVRARGGVPDLVKLRAAYVATAAKQFAAEFIRAIGSAPKGTSENLALGAIIASTLAQTARQFPIVPPEAIPAMSMLIHKTLQPQLPGIARMAAAIATVRPMSSPRPGAALRELAW